MPLNHFRTVTTVRSDLFLAAWAWIYFEPEPPFSLLLTGARRMLPASTLVTRQSPSNLDRYSDGSSVVLFCCGLIGSVSFSHSYEIVTLFYATR